MQTLSPSLLLWKRMSSETLEEGEKWTQEDVRQKGKIKKYIYKFNTCMDCPRDQEPKK